MITEDYVSFEVAKLLKEKGFDIPTVFVWYEHTPYITNKKVNNKPSMDFIYLTDSPEDERFFRFSNNDKIPEYIFGNVYSCPTHQMAMKWLRNKGIYVQIRRNINTYLYGAIMRKDGSSVYATIQSKHETYEEATEVALKYVLENLI